MAADEPDLVVGWLFAVKPTDRALDGWAPQAYVRQCYGSFIQDHEGGLPVPPPLRMWQPGSAGEAANPS